jgi:DNA-binding transcriptional ArsR family regulator
VAKIADVDALQVVGEPRRREILRLVWDRERSAGDIAAHFDVTFGAVSQHLGVLQEAGLVSMRKDGTRRFYRANRSALRPFAHMLQAMWAAELDTLALLAEEAEKEGTQPSGRARPGRRSSGRSSR